MDTTNKMISFFNPSKSPEEILEIMLHLSDEYLAREKEYKEKESIRRQRFIQTLVEAGYKIEEYQRRR